MQRKSEVQQQVFTTGRLIKPAQPFATPPLSEQKTLSPPPPLEGITARTTEKLFHFGDDTPGAPLWLQRALPKKHIYQKPINQKSKRSRKKRRIILSIVCAFLALVIVGGVIVATTVQNLANSNNLLAAPPTIQVAIDAQAIHNLIAGLNTSQESVSDISIVPEANNGVNIGLTMLISGSGLNRKLPLEIDMTLGGSMQPHKNILTIQHFIRDGVDAGPQAAANMQATVNQLLEKVLPLPGSNNMLDLSSLLSAPGSLQQTSSRACGNGSIVLQLGLPLQVQLGLPFSHPYVLQVGVDSYLGLDQKGNLLFHLDRITYGNGNGIGTLATNAARQVISQLFTNPSSSSNSSTGSSSNLTGPISQIKLLSLSTTSQVVCGKSTEMVVMKLGPAPAK